MAFRCHQACLYGVACSAQRGGRVLPSLQRSSVAQRRCRQAAAPASSQRQASVQQQLRQRQQQQQQQQQQPAVLAGDTREAAAAAGALAGCLALGAVLAGAGLAWDPALPPGAVLPSSALGWAYFLAWSLSFWPQLVANATRRSVEGLSADYVLYSTLGYAAYAAYTGGLLFWDPARDAYLAAHGGSPPDVQLTDLLFAGHALAVSLATLVQCAVYDDGGRRDGLATSATCRWVVGGSVAAIAAAAVAAALQWAAPDVVVVVAAGGGPEEVVAAGAIIDTALAVAADAGPAASAVASAAATADVAAAAAADVAASAALNAGAVLPASPAGLEADLAAALAAAAPIPGAPTPAPGLLTLWGLLGSVKLVMTLIKYTPQVALNAARRSTEGWSLSNVLLDLGGGLLSFAQVCCNNDVLMTL
jgi:PQ loop repeat